MTEKKITTAVLGLNDKGQLLAEAAARLGSFELAAVADKDTGLAESTAGKYGCTAYDDYRQLIMQNQLDCLIVAAGMHSCDEHIKTAMKKKFNILKLAPVARDFEEAAEFVRLAEDEGIKFAVANELRFSQSFSALAEFLEQHSVEQIFLIEAVCIVGDKPAPQWQSDWKLSGGGVLLRNCFGLIDQIVTNFKVPEQVYSLNINQAGDRQQRLYLTEDTALLTMKFNDTLIGNLITSKAFGQEKLLLKIYGKEKILTVTNSTFTVSDHSGKTVRKEQFRDNEVTRMKKLLEKYAQSFILSDKSKLYSSGMENLHNMAVIESAYLSARTAMPEEPARILQMASKLAGKPISI